MRETDRIMSYLTTPIYRNDCSSEAVLSLNKHDIRKKNLLRFKLNVPRYNPLSHVLNSSGKLCWLILVDSYISFLCESFNAYKRYPDQVHRLLYRVKRLFVCF